MNILIIGCGRVGASLAVILAKKGHDVAVLDNDGERLEKLRGSFSGLTFRGVPIDNEVLRQAGIASCDAVCAVTDEDNTNIMISEIAREIYKIKTVVTRVFDSRKGEIFEKLGLQTVCSTALTVDAICSSLDEYEEEQYIKYGSKQFKFYTAAVPKEYYGEKAYNIELEEGEVIFGIERADGTVKLLNNFNVELLEGDSLILSRIIV